MAILKFPIEIVKKLVAESDDATEYVATLDDLFNADLYPNKVLVNSDGKTEEEVEKNGGLFWPSSDYIDGSKIKPSLQLVGDSGVYLITNADVKGTPAERGTVAYAVGMNPEVDEDYYERKRDVFGGDDGSVSIPVGWARWAVVDNKKHLELSMTPTSVSLCKS